MFFLDIGYFSDKGNKRKINQDRVLVLSNDKSALFVVADGMGGMESGEYASTLVIKKMREWWYKSNNTFSYNSDKAVDMLYCKINDINNLLVDYCAKNNIKTGTTLSLVFIFENYAIAAYSGDTRIYHISGNSGAIVQVSEDETLYSYYERYENNTGAGNSEKNKSVLISYIGRANSIPVSFKKIDIASGDMFLILISN